MSVKTYKKLGAGFYSTTIKVGSSTKGIRFRTMTHGSLASFTTNEKEVQKALENHADFGAIFVLDKEEKDADSAVKTSGEVVTDPVVQTGTTEIDPVVQTGTTEIDPVDPTGTTEGGEVVTDPVDPTVGGEDKTFQDVTTREGVMELLIAAGKKPRTFDGILKAIEDLGYSFPSVDFDSWKEEFASKK
jgi:hypothetical protein